MKKPDGNMPEAVETVQEFFRPELGTVVPLSPLRCPLPRVGGGEEKVSQIASSCQATSLAMPQR
jgi:hypothetical protein